MGRTRGGAGRVALAAVVLAVLAFFAVLLVRLDARLSEQASANRRTLASTNSIVSLNRAVASRLDDVTALTQQAKASLAATSSVTPLLDQLHGALASVTATVGSAGGGAAASQSSLVAISGLLTRLQTQTAALASSSTGLSAQEGAVVSVLKGMVGDLQAALADARRIRQLFDPGPPT